MKLQIYSDSMLVHYKCGTRFLDKQFNVGEEVNKFKFNPENINDYSDRIKYIIIRDPLDHLISAIFTEIKEIELNEQYIDVLLKKMLFNKNAHWTPNLYEILFNFTKKKRCTLINIKDLSNFIKHELKIKHISRYENEYDFIKTIYKNRDEMIVDLTKNHLDTWSKLLHIVNEERGFLKQLNGINDVYQLVEDDDITLFDIPFTATPTPTPTPTPIPRSLI